MFAIAICIGVMALGNVFDNLAFLWGGVALFAAVTIGGVIYMNTSKKVRRK